MTCPEVDFDLKMANTAVDESSAQKVYRINWRKSKTQQTTHPDAFC